MENPHEEIRNDAEIAEKAPTVLPVILKPTFEHDGDCTEIVASSQDGGIIPNSRINIESSSDVVIGPLTQFHGPVTIYQNIKADSQTSCNIIGNGDPTENVPAKHNSGSPEKEPVESSKKIQEIITDRKFVIPASVCVVILLSVVVVVVLSTNIQNEPISPNNDGNNSSNSNSTEDDEKIIIGDHLMLTRNDWGGRPPLNYTKPLPHPTDYVVISHTAGGFCSDFENCCSVMQHAQAMHVSKLKSPDIGYNFVIGGDGNIYIGRGWDTRNFHGENNIGVCFAGNYIYDELNARMISALEQLLKFGVEKKKLVADYKLVGHNQTYSTLSPGENVYKVISKFKNFYPRLVRL